MKTIIALLVTLMLLLTACSVYDNSPDPCPGLEGAEKNNCYLENLKCSKISDEMNRDLCVVELAKVAQDWKVCDLIKDKQVMANCQHKIAVELNDPSLCNKIENKYWENNCHADLAVNNNNQDFCSLITNTVQRESCFETIALATNDHLLCEFLNSADKVKCIYTIAKETKDVTLCADLTSPINQDTCRKKVAELSENKELCELIKFKQIREDCEDNFI